MARKTLTQIAKEARTRTEKWREDRTVRKVPEARQVDKAVLMALIHLSKNGAGIAIDEQRFAEALQLAVRLLVGWRCDGAEAVAMVRKRLRAFHESTEIADMLRRPTRSVGG
ncbi:hypothetical protein [Aureimonas leprariae]|uniref:Uncharacterized protein n=1 Tax=Plantimonas leprariae TaxID=2615207 RepID=A0A7V7PK63_9HYPH|nr:hypothetical protein [Aureimonas leprariae]KAB0676021.1 hypothetical protein F6X38_22430 [Aureimonas leprariae]